MARPKQTMTLAEKITPAAQKRAAARMSPEMEMAGLREALEVTQVQLAKALGTTQAAVCRLEREPRNTRLGTLRKYVESLGGSVEVHAKFGDRIIELTNLATDRRRRSRGKAKGSEKPASEAGK